MYTPNNEKLAKTKKNVLIETVTKSIKNNDFNQATWYWWSVKHLDLYFWFFEHSIRDSQFDHSYNTRVNCSDKWSFTRLKVLIENNTQKNGSKPGFHL